MIVDRSKQAAGRVLVRVVGAKGTYPVVPADLPLRATVVLGGLPPAATDRCGQTAFGPTDCEFNRKRTAVSCVAS